MSKPDEIGKVDVIEELREALPEAHELTLQQQKLSSELDDLIARLSPELHPVARAIHNLRQVLPAALTAASLIGVPTLPIPVIDALSEALEDAAKALGI
jgi:hypothetical protein